MPSRAGSPNKRKQALISLLEQKYPGWQPVCEIAEAAQHIGNRAREATAALNAVIDGSAEEVDKQLIGAYLDTEITLWKEYAAQCDRVAKYVTPQLKAVEMTGNDGEPLRIGLVQFGSDGTDS